MFKVLLVLFIAGKPSGAMPTPDVQTCEAVRAEVMADPSRPGEVHAACYVLREKA